MEVRPFSAADLLRQNSPRKYANHNHFAQLRDESPALGNEGNKRFRSPSVKRKPEDSNSYLAMASKNISQDTESEDSAQALELIGISTGKVTSLCEKVKAELVTLGAEPEICTIFNYLCEAIRCINESQASLAEHQLKVKKTVWQLPASPFKKS